MAYSVLLLASHDGCNNVYGSLFRQDASFVDFDMYCMRISCVTHGSMVRDTERNIRMRNIDESYNEDILHCILATHFLIVNTFFDQSGYPIAVKNHTKSHSFCVFHWLENPVFRNVYSI